MSDNVLVSVIITAYNSEEYLQDAINSVIDQTYSNHEIIIVDDGSQNKECENIVKRISKKTNIPIYYYYQDNQGPSAARNKGLFKSRGKYIAFLDSDDVYEPQKLNIQVEILERLNNQYAFVSGGSKIYYEQGGNVKNNLPKYFDGNIYSMLVYEDINKLGLNGTPGHLFRKNALLEVNGYDEELRNFEDFDLLIRLSRNHKVLIHQDVVCRIRKRSGSLSNENPSRNLVNTLSFIDKLSKLDTTIPDAVVMRKKQNASFSTASKFMLMGDFKNFSRVMQEGVKNYGFPITRRGRLAYSASKLGFIGYIIIKTYSYLRSFKNGTININE
jgi:glycosyltransferase involved in cell wall biosynthesis